MACHPSEARALAAPSARPTPVTSWKPLPIRAAQFMRVGCDPGYSYTSGGLSVANRSFGQFSGKITNAKYPLLIREEPRLPEATGIGAAGRARRGKSNSPRLRQDLRRVVRQSR